MEPVTFKARLVSCLTSYEMYFDLSKKINFVVGLFRNQSDAWSAI